MQKNDRFEAKLNEKLHLNVDLQTNSSEKDPFSSFSKFKIRSEELERKLSRSLRTLYRSDLTQKN